MYGMVNQAVKEMVLGSLGAEQWENICKHLNISTEDFSPFLQFDDSVTLGIVENVCNVTQMPAELILENFGVFWIEYARKSDYQIILNTFATSPYELINSLNALHERLELSFTDLNAPSFETIEQNDSSITVNYYSNRDLPLKFFVKGLFIGIFKMFNKNCEVTLLETLGDAKATFLIKEIDG